MISNEGCAHNKCTHCTRCTLGVSVTARVHRVLALFVLRYTMLSFEASIVLFLNIYYIYIYIYISYILYHINNI